MKWKLGLGRGGLNRDVRNLDFVVRKHYGLLHIQMVVTSFACLDSLSVPYDLVPLW